MLSSRLLSRVERRLEESGVPTYCSAVSLAEIYPGIRPGGSDGAARGEAPET